MTVLVREELNDSDLAWVAADLAAANVLAEALRIQAMLAPAATTGHVVEEPLSRPVHLLARVAAAGFQ